MICKIKISEQNDKKGCELTQPHDHKTSATTNEDSMGKKFHFKKLTLIDDNDAMADLHGAYSRSL